MSPFVMAERGVIEDAVAHLERGNGVGALARLRAGAGLRPVPLVSSPNLLLPDRLAMAALEQANRRYEIVFTAFDTLARRAAAAAGLGYFPLPRVGGARGRW